MSYSDGSGTGVKPRTGEVFTKSGERCEMSFQELLGLRDIHDRGGELLGLSVSPSSRLCELMSYKRNIDLLNTWRGQWDKVSRAGGTAITITHFYRTAPPLSCPRPRTRRLPNSQHKLENRRALMAQRSKAETSLNSRFILFVYHNEVPASCAPAQAYIHAIQSSSNPKRNLTQLPG